MPPARGGQQRATANGNVGGITLHEAAGVVAVHPRLIGYIAYFISNGQTGAGARAETASHLAQALCTYAGFSGGSHLVHEGVVGLSQGTDAVDIPVKLLWFLNECPPILMLYGQ